MTLIAAGAGVRAAPRSSWACRRPRIIFRHLLPNMASLLIIDATINVGGAIIAETGLSFFGFGVQPPDVSLGTLIADGTRSALDLPVAVPVPGRLPGAHRARGEPVGDGLRDALDPSSAKSGGDREPHEAASPPAAATAQPLLGVQDLHVDLPGEAGRVTAVRGAELRRSRRARSLGIVGESGSGKSVVVAGDHGPAARRRRGSPARCSSTGASCSGCDDRELSQHPRHARSRWCSRTRCPR